MNSAESPRAVVVFSGQADLAWLRLLSPGFRHCFVLVEAPGGWICVNPLAHRTSVELWPALELEDLLRRLRDCDGLTVTVTTAELPPRRAAPIGVFSCVEAVKRIVGLHDRWVLTPRQLHRRLQKVKNPLTPEQICLKS